jgi:hypothetical protein
MIQPLRRRHRRLIVTLFLLLVLAAILARTHRPIDPRIHDLSRLGLEPARTGPVTGPRR